MRRIERCGKVLYLKSVKFFVKLIVQRVVPHYYGTELNHVNSLMKVSFLAYQ